MDHIDSDAAAEDGDDDTSSSRLLSTYTRQTRSYALYSYFFIPDPYIFSNLLLEEAVFSLKVKLENELLLRDSWHIIE